MSKEPLPPALVGRWYAASALGLWLLFSANFDQFRMDHPFDPTSLTGAVALVGTTTLAAFVIEAVLRFVHRARGGG